jgi:hypothetical protein
VSASSALLRAFADRRASENDLSDMLYAAMRISSAFAADVCGLFDFQIAAGAKCSVQREFAADVGRPDLMVTTDDERMLIIEVKLDDRDYHFDQYGPHSADFKRAQVGLLTNHALNPKDRHIAKSWTAVQWSRLLDFIDERQYGASSDAISAFSAYARKVCRRERLSAMRFDYETFASLRALTAVLRKIVEDVEIPHCSTSLYTRGSSSYGAEHFGYYYEIKTENGLIAYPFFGLSFNLEDDFWCGIEMWRDYGDLASFTHLSQRLPNARKVDLVPRTSSTSFWFTFFQEPKERDRFNSQSLKQQEKDLTVFYKAVTSWMAAELVDAARKS